MTVPWDTVPREVLPLLAAVRMFSTSAVTRPAPLRPEAVS